MARTPLAPLRESRAFHLALVLCGLYLVVAILLTHDDVGFSPDGADTAVVARNLARGAGYTIDVVHFHPGLEGALPRVPDLHGILRPLQAAVLFSLFGPHEGLLRGIGFVFVAATGLLAFAMARRLFDDHAGLIALALTLASHRLNFQAWMGLDDAGFVFFSLAALVVLHASSLGGSALGFAFGGLMAALATLEKASGLSLLGVVAVAALLLQGSWATRARCAVMGTLPVLAALAAYLVRNFYASGAFMFSFGPLEWRFKEGGFENLFAVYENPQSLSETLADLGGARVLEIIWEQFALFAAAVSPLQAPFGFAPLVVPAFLPLCALLCLPWLWSRHRGFAFLAMTSTLGLLGFVCILYHSEPRYFAPLIPLIAIIIAGALSGPVTSFAGSFAPKGRVAIPVAIAASIAGAEALATANLPALLPKESCLPIYEWIRSSTPASARVITSHPSALAWYGERGGIQIPSGDASDLAAVARHYEAEWLMLRPTFVVTSGDAAAARQAGSGAPPLNALKAKSHGKCAIYRLGITPRAN